MRLVAMFLLATIANAATYYVQKTGSSDSNNCTVGSPCLTIARGLAVATAAGSVLQIGAGTYSESVTVSTSGSSGNPITIRGHDGTGCPTSVNSDINSRGYRPNPGVVTNGWTISASYIKIECFKLATGEFYVNTNRNYLEFYDNYVTGPLLDMQSGGSPTATPQNVTAKRNYATQGWIGMAIQCRTCTFEDNELERPIGGNGSDGDYTHVFGSDIVLRNNYFHGASMTDCNANGGGCHIDCVQTWNIGGTDHTAKNITIDRNTCFNFHEGIIARDTTHATPFSHDNWVVTNNIFAHGPIGDGSPWCALFEHVSNVYSYHNICNDTAGYSYLEGSTGTHRNNIHVAGGNNPYGGTSNGWGSGTVTSSNNLLYQSGLTYSGWSGDVLNQNPNFTAIGSDNYHLASNSPAKDAGTNAGVTVDRDGNARPFNTLYDIGPYEYGAGAGVAPTITSTSPLPAGTVGAAYSQTLTATGDATITWSVTSGSLSAGLSLSSGGAITGTPTTAGTSTPTITATNSTGSDAKVLSITINAAPAGPTAGVAGKVTVSGKATIK